MQFLKVNHETSNQITQGGQILFVGDVHRFLFIEIYPWQIKIIFGFRKNQKKVAASDNFMEN